MNSLMQPTCIIVYIKCNPAPRGSPFKLSLGVCSNSRVLSSSSPLRVSCVVVCPRFCLGSPHHSSWPQRDDSTHHGQTCNNWPVPSSSRMALLLVGIFANRSNCRTLRVAASQLWAVGIFGCLYVSLTYIPFNTGHPTDICNFSTSHNSIISCNYEYVNDVGRRLSKFISGQAT